jgi:hypothetical protein
VLAITKIDDYQGKMKDLERRNRALTADNNEKVKMFDHGNHRIES